MPRLAVCMPVRNGELTVLAAVKAVLRTLPKDGVLVVWDDASTDGTGDILSNVRDQRLRTFRSDSPLGSGEARTRALRSIDSEFVANVDADDICLPGRFSIPMRYLEQNSSTADVAFGAALKFGQRRPRPTLPLFLSSAFSPVALVCHDPFIHSTVTATRSAYERVGYYRPLPVSQDYDLWLRMASNRARLVRLPVPIVAYRQSATQVSADPQFLERVLGNRELNDSHGLLWQQIRADLAVHVGGQAGLLATIDATPASRLVKRYYRRIVTSQKTTLSSEI